MTLTLLGILFLALAAFTYISYRHDLSRARRRVTSGSHLVNTANGPIEYADVGRGLPVLAIHGAGGGFDQGLEIVQPLIDRGFRVIAVSRFGYLRTPLPADASPLAQADEYAALLDALKLDQVAVIGGSAGAPSAMQLCLRYPEKCSALVLLFPLAFAPSPAQTGQTNDSARLAGQPSPLFKLVIKTALHSDLLFWLATKLARNVLIKTVLGTPVEDFRTASSEEQERALQIMRHILPISQRENGIWNDTMIGSSLPRYDLEKMRAPTLLIAAEDDLYGTFPGARYTSDHIPGARYVGFQTGGHLLLGHWMEVNAEVARFLSEHH